MTALLYRAAPELTVIDYEEESVLFNARTWETHLLNAAAAEVLALCARTPCSLQHIAQALAQWLTPEEAVHASGHAEQIVETLLGLRLIDEIIDEIQADVQAVEV